MLALRPDAHRTTQARPAALGDISMAYNSAAGWCPFATRKPAAAGNSSDANSSSFGRVAFDAAVMHVTEGPRGDEFGSAIRWFQNPLSRVSAHFTISPTGEIAQHVSIYDVAYANGLSYTNGQWYNPRGVKVSPSWRGLRTGVNPNRTTISIEHAGQHPDPWPKAMMDANTALLQWIGSVVPSLRVLTPYQNLIGHFQLDPVDRANCPGPHVDFAAIANAVNNFPKAPAQTFTPYIGVGTQRIRAETFAAVLRDHGSPLVNDAAYCYHRLVESNMDAAAYIGHIHVESQMGKDRPAFDLCNAWNIKAMGTLPAVGGFLDFSGGPNGGGGWWLGHDFYISYMKLQFGAQELYTIEQIAPIYVYGRADADASAYIAKWIQTANDVLKREA
jgi:N-acetyl-anhydromuramyl-L-alanine amidase AmpD